MTEWFTDYKDVIAGFASFATIVGLLATAAAIVVAAIQLNLQRLQNKAQAMYEIQRDARAEAWRLLADDSLARAVYGQIPDKGRAAVASALNFYSAAFQMRQHRVLDDRLWRLLASELPDLLAPVENRRLWERIKKGFDQNFVREVAIRVPPFEPDGRPR